MLQALSWPACSFPVYTVGLVALLASYSYIGTLRMSELRILDDGQGSDWRTAVAGGATVPDENFTSNARWLSWNASDTALSDGMTSPSSPLTTNSSLLNTSRSEPRGSSAKSTDAEVKGQGRQQTQQVNGQVKPARGTLTGSIPTGQLMTANNAITAVQWIALHITVGSLFFAMRRLGSNFWLAIGVFMSSTYAFSFGLVVTVKLGFPITAGLLLEGIPFFVNIIGFTKHVMLTKSVLAHSLWSPNEDTTSESSGAVVSNTHDAIRRAIGEAGSTVVRKYALEITVSAAGSLLTRSTPGALHSFCVLAICVLAFDCILLFTFFTAILMVKLEITRIRRQVDIGDNLEEDGISHDVAVSVARRTAPLSGNDAEDGVSHSPSPPSKLSRFTVFKAAMLAVFVAINISNLYAIPLRSANPWTQHPLSRRVHGANYSRHDALQSVMPIPLTSTYETTDFIDSPTVKGFVESLEDPILSKWIAFALALSVVFNGYLFKTATTRPAQRRNSGYPIDRRELDEAENFTSATSESDATPAPGLQTSEASHITEIIQDSDERENPSDRDSTSERTPPRSPEEIDQMLKTARTHELGDEEVASLALSGRLPSYALEKTLKDHTRAVKIRRSVISRSKATVDLTKGLEGSKLPYKQYNYADVFGACCENVVSLICPCDTGRDG